jgi:hypothetical protein
MPLMTQETWSTMTPLEQRRFCNMLMLPVVETTEVRAIAANDPEPPDLDVPPDEPGPESDEKF